MLCAVAYPVLFLCKKRKVENHALVSNKSVISNQNRLNFKLATWVGNPNSSDRGQWVAANQAV